MTDCSHSLPPSVAEAVAGLDELCRDVSAGTRPAALASNIVELATLQGVIHDAATRDHGRGLTHTCARCGDQVRFTVDNYRQEAPRWSEQLVRASLTARSGRMWVPATFGGHDVDAAPSGVEDPDDLIEVKAAGAPDLAGNRKLRPSAPDVAQRIDERVGWAVDLARLNTATYAQAIRDLAGTTDDDAVVTGAEMARVAATEPRLWMLLIVRVTGQADMRRLVGRLQNPGPFKGFGLCAWTISEGIPQAVSAGPDLPDHLLADRALDQIAGTVTAVEVPDDVPSGWQASLFA